MITTTIFFICFACSLVYAGSPHSDPDRTNSDCAPTSSDCSRPLSLGIRLNWPHCTNEDPRFILFLAIEILGLAVVLVSHTCGI